LHERRLGEGLLAAGRQRERRRHPPPVAEEDHPAHHVLVRKRPPGVLAAQDRDLDAMRIVAGEPDPAAAMGASVF